MVAGSNLCAQHEMSSRLTLRHSHVTIIYITLHTSRIRKVATQHVERLCLSSGIRCINQQVLCLVTVHDTHQSSAIQQRLIESKSTIAQSLARIVVSMEIYGRHTRISGMRISVSIVLLLGIGHQVKTRVKVSHTHILITIIGRCTIDAVAAISHCQAVIILIDVRRHFLMRALLVPAIGQHLSEVEVVIRPDRIEMTDPIRIDKRTLVFGLWYHTVGIAEVAITKTPLDITTLFVIYAL